MRRPLALIGFTYIAALTAASFFGFAVNASLSVLFALCACVVLLALGFAKHAKTSALLFFTAAAALAAWCFADYFWYAPAMSLNSATAEIRGVITDLPEQSGSLTAYTVKTDSITVNGQTKRFGTKIRVYFSGSLNARPYDHVTMTAKLYLPSENRGSGYSSRSYYKSKGIYLFAKPADAAKPAEITPNKRPPLLYYALETRVWMLGAIHTAITGMEGNLAGGILLGDVSGLSDKVKNDFKITGISHILAVSGTQTSLIAEYLLLLLCTLKVPRKASCALSIAAVGAFVAITGFSPSVSRAGVMSMLFLAAMMIGREPDALTSLGVSVLVLCAVNPFAATDAGLQLSFTATLGMILLSGRMNAFVAKRTEHWRPFPRSLLLKPAAVLSETIGASLLTFPVIMLTFGQVSLVALVSNLVEVPVSLFVTLATAALVFFSLFPVPAFLFIPLGWAIKACCAFMIWYAGALASLPFASVSSGYFFINLMLLLALCLTVVYLLFRGRGANLAVCVVCCCFALSAGALSHVVAAKGVLEVASLPVGNGSCTVLIKDGSAAVVDLSGYNAEYQAESFLKKRNIKKLDMLILTSYSAADANAANTLAKRFPCREVYCPESFSASAGKNVHMVKSSEQVTALKTVLLKITQTGDRNLLVNAVYKASSVGISGRQALGADVLPSGFKSDILIFNGSVSKEAAKALGPQYAVSGDASAALSSCAGLESGGSYVKKPSEGSVVSYLTRGDGRYMEAKE